MTGVATQILIQMRLDKQRDEQKPHWIVIREYLLTSCGIGGTEDPESIEINKAEEVTEPSQSESSENETSTAKSAAGQYIKMNQLLLQMVQTMVAEEMM